MKSLIKRVSLYLSLLGIGVAIFGSLLNLIPATVDAAPSPQFCAANGLYYDPATQTCVSTNPSQNPAPSLNTGFWALPLPEQAKVWTELNAITGCTLNASRAGVSAVATDPKSWFRSGAVDVGSHVDPTDGRLDCQDENGWVTQLLNDAGFSGNYSAAYDASSGNSTKLKQILIHGISGVSDGLFGIANPPSTIPDQLKYWILMQAFTDTHGDTACAATPLSTGTPDQINAQKAKYSNGPVDIWVSNGGKVYSQPFLYNHQSDTITVGPGVPSGATTYSCGALASILSSSPEGLNLATAFANNDSSDDPTQPAGSDANAAAAGCDLNGDPFTWFLCPVIDALEGFVQKIDNFITEALTFNTNYFYDQTPGFKTAWNSFRIIATGFLVIAGLVMIGSQALGLEMLDAYTIKKVLPRLLIAIIGISLSWPLTRYANDFFNILGVDIRDLIYSPFSSLQGTLSGGATAVLAGGAVAGLLLLGPLALLSFLATAALAVLVGFVIIMVRYLALLVIIIFAPVAIAAYVLPNTQKLWNLWKDNFLGLLLVFPIISAFIAIGKVFSAVSLSGGSNGAFAGQTIMQITGLAAYFLPYFMLPIAFRLATGVIGTIAGFVNDRNKGAFDGLRNFRKRQYQEHGGRKVEAAKRYGMQKRANAAAALQANATGGWAKRKAFGWASRQVGGYNVEAAMSARQAAVNKEINDQIATGRDEEIRGLTVNKRAAMEAWRRAQAPGHTQADKDAAAKLVRQGKNGLEFRSLGGQWVHEGAVDAGRNRWGNDAFAQQAALSYEMRKASSEEELQGLASRYSTLAQGAGGWGMTDRQAGGAWIGAAFENQNQHLEYKATNWKTGGFTDDSGKFDMEKTNKFVDEVYEKKGSYPLSQMGSNTVEQLKNAYRIAQQSNDVDAQRKIAAISETFMHEVGMPGAAGQIRDEGGQPVTDVGTAAGGRRQVAAPGAAHVAERAYELARITGVLKDAPTGMYGAGHAPSPNQRAQH